MQHFSILFTVLFEAIRNDSRLGFSLASFVRQATSLKEKWLREVCVRGRLCPPPEHWHRNLLLCPPCGAELPQDFQQFFTDGKPWFFDSACLPPSHAQQFCITARFSGFTRRMISRCCLNTRTLRGAIVLYLSFLFHLEGNKESLSLYCGYLFRGADFHMFSYCVFTSPVGYILGSLLVVSFFSTL